MKLLQYSSSLIFIPALIAIAHGYWIDFLIISILTVASTIHHTYYTNVTWIIDQLALYLLIFHTFNIAINNYIIMNSYIGIVLFILGVGYMAIIYVYGKYNNCFAFHPKIRVADLYHASMHIFGIFIYSISFYILAGR